MKKALSPTVGEYFRLRPEVSRRLGAHAKRTGKAKAWIVNAALLGYFRKNRKRR